MRKPFENTPKPVYHSETDTYHLPYNPRTDSIGMTVVSALEAVKGGRPEEIERLCEAINPDALDALFQCRADGTPRKGACIEFLLDGSGVTVHTTGEIIIDLGESTEQSESAGQE